MADIIKVSPQQLTTTATTLGTQATQLQTLTSSMLQLISQLSGVWTGEASAAYLSKFASLSDDMDKMYRMVQEHSTDLTNMAQVYQNAENANAEAAQGLPADVIV